MHNKTDYSEAAYEQQLADKQAYLQQLLLPFNVPEPEIFRSIPLNFRMRAEFRVWYQNGEPGYAMFNPGDKHTPVLMEQFPVASKQINALMPRLKAAWTASAALSFKLFQVEFLTTLSGEALVTLCYHRPLDGHWQQHAQQLAEQLGICIVGRSRGKRLVIGNDYVTEQLKINGRAYSYRQPEGAFTQPNAQVNQKMLGWAQHALEQHSSGNDLLELYCGNGNFTLPLSTKVRQLLATEISKTSVKAALANLADNGITNVELVRLSAEEMTLALQGVRPFRRLAHVNLENYDFDTVFVDPPRAGLDSETCELVRNFTHILYISCNPQTLAANIAQLSDTHRISRCALFDQFPWTQHMEAGVLLKKA